MQKEFEDNISA